MTSSPLLAAVIGAVFGLAVLLLVVAVRGSEPRPGTPALQLLLARAGRQYGGVRLGVALVAAAGVAVLTRWPVAVLAAGVLAYAWPAMFGRHAGGAAAIARLDALATWTESLKDTIAAAAGLEQAIPATVPAASAVIQPHLARLAGRLAAREPLPSALAMFARDLDDPSAEQIVAALILNSRLRGPGLRETLSGLTRSARQELDLRRRVEARQKSIRHASQAIIGITLAFTVGLKILNPQFLAPYDSPVGQAWLILVVGVFAAGMAWARNIAREQIPEPFLDIAALTGEALR